MENLDVIALGGNAILPAGQAGTISEQFTITRKTMGQVAAMVASGRRVVLTHGNGPVVGNILLRNEALRDTIPPMPLGICVADSQGGIGYMLQQVLRNALAAADTVREVVALVTQVRVSAGDPAFDSPTKPIGPFYNEMEAEKLRAENGWEMTEDSKRGYRRVVPSPRPLEIIEETTIRRLLESGTIVITVGGGGVPVTASGSLLEGVEAVVDKDYATSVLARDLSAERLIIVTSIDAVYKNYGTDAAEPVSKLTVAQARAFVESEHIPRGSMGAKLDAAAEFVEATGGDAIITDHVNLLRAVRGEAGTRITGDA